MINSFAPDREFWDQVPAFSLYTEAAAIKNFRAVRRLKAVRETGEYFRHLALPA